MKKLSLFLIFALLIGVNICFDNNNNINDKEIHNNLIEDGNAKMATEASETTITMKDIADFLKTKKEHYPLSDEFIERYQQDGGGYIDNARKAGLVVDKQLHEPNQKWHFFDSWLYPSIEDNTLSWEEDAKSRVYSKLLCPELLLWIYEACEVSPSKVRDAKIAAEQGKVAKSYAATIAKNMRAVVSWNDLYPALVEFKNNGSSEEDKEEYSVVIKQGNGYTVSGLKEKYAAGSEVTFNVIVTDSSKVIDTVKINDDVISPISGNQYKFTMPNNDVVINVTLKNKQVDIPADSSTVAVYNIKYDLGTRKTAKLIEDSDELLNTFEFSGQGTDIINAIEGMEYIYGGGNGGSGDNRWYTGDLLKFGTTSVNGYLSLSLSCEINAIKIYGYVSNESCNIQVGNSTSLEWSGQGIDGMTTSVTCSDMTVTSKEVIEGKQTSSMTINFETTTSLRIAVTNKKPLYISSIEFIMN